MHMLSAALLHIRHSLVRLEHLVMFSCSLMVLVSLSAAVKVSQKAVDLLVHVCDACCLRFICGLHPVDRLPLVAIEWVAAKILRLNGYIASDGVARCCNQVLAVVAGSSYVDGAFGAVPVIPEILVGVIALISGQYCATSDTVQYQHQFLRRRRDTTDLVLPRVVGCLSQGLDVRIVLIYSTLHSPIRRKVLDRLTFVAEDLVALLGRLLNSNLAVLVGNAPSLLKRCRA